MKKSTDFKSKIKFSNYILGKVFVVVLSVLVLALIYRNSFQHINVYSILAGLLLISSLGYKSANYLSSSAKNLSLIDQLEFALLFTLVFGIILEISGNSLFSLSYVLLPIVVLGLGWHAAGLSFVIISVLQITKFQSPSPAYQIVILLISTLVLGYLLKGNKIVLGSNILKKIPTKAGRVRVLHLLKLPMTKRIRII